MKKTLINWLLSAVALNIIVWFLPGMSMRNFAVAVIAALLLGLVSALVKPALQMLSLPVSFLSIGVASVAVNAVMLGLTSVFVKGFYISSILSAIIAAIVMSFLNMLFIGGDNA
jgi:putative membrane protein